MPKKSDSPWTTVSLHPLLGMLDTRSRPADIAVGGYRWRLNMSTSTEGKMCRRDGFERFFADVIYDNNGVPKSDPSAGAGIVIHNHDHHHQGAAREPITLMFESTGSDGTRRFFDGTQSRVSLLNATTGYYTDILTGKGGAGTRWKAAELQDTVIFTNNYDEPYAFPLPAGPAAIMPDLSAVMHVTKARVVIEFSGCMFLMNVFQDGKRQSSRVRWSDINRPTVWDPAHVDGGGNPDSIAGFQDLDYGDDILAAGLLLNNLYIFTRRSIWKCSVGSATIGGTGTFTFQRVYNEPKTQTGCLTFPNTLVCDGENFRYLSRESIYKYNPYMAAPEREDWIHKASGVIFRKSDTALNGAICDLPVAEYRPVNNELWISWASSVSSRNDWTLVCQTQYQTADVVDHGFSCFTNFRRTSTDLLCNEQQDFLGASTRDFAIKSMGGVFYREFIEVGADPTVDPPLDSPPAIYFTEGYNSQLRGLMPLGFTDRDKIVRDVLIDPDVSEQDSPCVMNVRVGNSFNLVDPNDTDDSCAPQWRDLGNKPLTCPDGAKIAALTAAGQRPGSPFHWPCRERGRFLMFEINVRNANGGPAVGGDACIMRIDFDVCALPKR